MKQKFMYDLFIIGGGSGGISCARQASKYSNKIALANFVKPTPHGIKWGLGGTCVNVGCIPKKLFHQASLLGESLQEASIAGWNIEKKGFNYFATQQKILSYIKKLNTGYVMDMMKNKIKYYNAFASFKDQHTIQIQKEGEIQNITAKNFLLATGQRPKFLQIENSNLCISSDDIFWRQQEPGKTLVIGSGYIGLETAGFLSGFGYETEVLYRSQVLKQFDSDMSSLIGKDMERRGIKFTKGQPIKFENVNSKIRVTKVISKNGKQENVVEDYDTVIQAIGREYDFSQINLENIGVKIEKSKKISVNENWETNISNIYAIGDIVEGNKELTPLAIREGEYLANRIFNNECQKIEQKYIPTTVFTPIEYSFVGMSEQEAIKYGEDEIDIFHTYFTPLEWIYSDKEHCYVKILVHKKTDIILGIHILSPNSGEIIQGFSLALQYKIKYRDMKKMIGVHPTLGEELLQLKFTKREEPNPYKTGC